MNTVQLINETQCVVIDNHHSDWIVFNLGFSANIKNWPRQLISGLSQKFNLLLYNCKGVYPYPPYPSGYSPGYSPEYHSNKPLDLSFPTLYNNLLQLIKIILPDKKPYLLGWSMGAAFVYYCVTRSHPYPEDIFKGAIIFAGRDYYNKFYPTVGREVLVRKDDESLLVFQYRVIRSLFPTSYLKSLGRIGLFLLLAYASINYYPLSTQVINAENLAIKEIDSGIVPIRSQWKKMASDSYFPMLIFHASQDGIVSQQYQVDMTYVIPPQWPVDYITYRGQDDLPQGGHYFFAEEDTLLSKGLTTNITNIIKEKFSPW